MGHQVKGHSNCLVLLARLLILLQGFPRALSFCDMIDHRATTRRHQYRFTSSLGAGPTEFGDKQQTLIYLVDDEESIRTAVGTFLATRRFHVVAFADAWACLEQLTQVASLSQQSTRSQTMPSLVISDIRMPGMDGIELLKAIRSDQSLVDLPVVLLTAKGRTPDRIEGYNAGADAYIPKPFDPEELVSVMEQVIKTHETLHRVSDPVIDIQNLKRDMVDIKKLLLEQGGGGAGMNGFVNSKDAMNEDRVFLTPDERDILVLLCDGQMNKEIANKMSLSKPRVASLLTQMFRKAKVKNRTELARWAIKNGFVQV